MNRFTGKLAKSKVDIFLISTVLFVLTFFIYYFASPGQSPYDYFTRLAVALANGKLFLTESPPWLNELIPFGGRYFVVYPPMPALLLVPFVIIFGANFSQTLFSCGLGAVNVALVWVMLRRLNISRQTSFLVAILFGLGTNHFFLASTGSAWYLAHVVAVFFVLLALIESFGERRLFMIGLLLGAAFWARSTVILSACFFLIYLHKLFWPPGKKQIINLLFFGLGLAVFVGLDLVYNFVRFGIASPLSPYQLIPDSQKGREFLNGFMSWRFIPKQVDGLLFRLPKMIDGFPFIIPSIYSLAIWVTTPAVVLVVWAKRSLLSLACWVGVIATFGLISFWAGVGYSQFGYRYAQDFMPLILILIALGIGKVPSKLSIGLVTVSILINIWGVVMINHIGRWFW